MLQLRHWSRRKASSYLSFEMQLAKINTYKTPELLDMTGQNYKRAEITDVSMEKIAEQIADNLTLIAETFVRP